MRGERLLGLLGPWRLPAPRVVEEIVHDGDRSRTWRVDTDDGEFVAKLVFDHREVVEPGLRIAAMLDRAGIVTGAPRLTASGALCRAVRSCALGWSWTLCLLRFVPGRPLEPADPVAPRLAGDLLGRVHRTLRGIANRGCVPAELLEFYAGEARRIGGSAGRDLADAVVAVRRFDQRVGLTAGVLYGDPAPEILCGGAAAPALIDWGTPSWGPLLHDVVSWQLYLRRNGAVVDAEERMLAAYQRYVDLPDAELAASGLLRALQASIRTAWRRRDAAPARRGSYRYPSSGGQLGTHRWRRRQ